jgi:ribosomal protein S12 methylthiotransferase
MAAQQAISLDCNKSWLGRELDVLVEYRRGADSVGRSFRDAPEIDGSVIFKGTSLQPGQIIRAKVTGYGPYDLVAEAVDADISAGVLAGVA